MKDFQKLIGHCHQISESIDDIVYIGGIAVYLHAINNGAQSEFTHDADFVVAPL